MLCRHLPFMDLLSAKEAMGGPISGEDRGGITSIITFSLSPFTYNNTSDFVSSLISFANSCKIARFR